MCFVTQECKNIHLFLFINRITIFIYLMLAGIFSKKLLYLVFEINTHTHSYTLLIEFNFTRLPHKQADSFTSNETTKHR